MTTKNYIGSTNQELLEEVKTLKISPICLNRMIKNHHHTLYTEILKRTQFLIPNSFRNCVVPMQARLYCLEHNLHEHPICHNPTCNNHVGWSKSNLEFQHHCCNACSNKDPETIKKAESTNMKNLGVKNAFQSEEKKRKIRETNLKNLGVENPSQSEDVKQKKIKTTQSHFGVDYPFQAEEVKQKIDNTFNERYGGYGLQSEIIMEKAKKTNLEKLGVEHPFQSQEIRDKAKKKWMITLGVDNPWKSEDIKKKIQQFWLDRFGVDNFSKTPLFASYCRKRIWHDNMWFDSNWEIIVYEFCKTTELIFQYSPEITIPYEYDGKQYSYHPDFIINEKIYEVKGDQFFRINFETGQEEMFLPYGRKRYGEKLWVWKCGKEAKHQCMLKNNVRILRGADIKNLNIELFIN